MPVQKPRQREKKIVNEPMEVKQYGPSQFTKNAPKQMLQRNTARPSTQIAQKTKEKKDPNRFKAISDRANAKRTDEQKASDKNLYGGDNISNIKGEKKNSAYKQYEKAFGRKKGR